MQLIIFGTIFLACFVAFFLYINKQFGAMKTDSSSAKELSERLDRTTKDVHETLDRVTLRLSERLDKVTDQVSLRLTENVKAINESKMFITGRVENTEKTVRDVTNKLASLQEASMKMLQTNSEILQFQQMLKIPKVRGGFGEVLLENLLAQTFPADKYQMQYKFGSTGEIADAVIRLLDGQIVVIDAKFPLANFEKIQQQDGEEKKMLYRAFINDIKKHVKDISTKYILPQEKTLDYAFMYIPMEGIYYEMIVRRAETTEELWEFCNKHKVIPVSPNSFIAYLYTLLMGFRGMKIEKQAKEMIAYIGQIQKDFSKFEEEYLTIGTHLTHAQNKYQETTRRLEKFGNRLEKLDIDNTDHIVAPVTPDEEQQLLV